MFSQRSNLARGRKVLLVLVVLADSPDVSIRKYSSLTSRRCWLKCSKATESKYYYSADHGVYTSTSSLALKD